MSHSKFKRAIARHEHKPNKNSKPWLPFQTHDTHYKIINTVAIPHKRRPLTVHNSPALETEEDIARKTWAIKNSESHGQTQPQKPKPKTMTMTQHYKHRSQRDWHAVGIKRAEREEIAHQAQRGEQTLQARKPSAVVKLRLWRQE